MWFDVTDQPTFAVAGFWQPAKEASGFTIVTCDPNELVAPIHPKAMITILQAEDRTLADRQLRRGSSSTAALSGGADDGARTGVSDMDRADALAYRRAQRFRLAELAGQLALAAARFM
jgi:hypothetical protein